MDEDKCHVDAASLLGRTGGNLLSLRHQQDHAFEKLSGVYRHRVRNRKIPLVRGFDDVFMAPHSRHTEVPQQLLEEDDRITILADSLQAGVFLCMAQEEDRFCDGTSGILTE